MDSGLGGGGVAHVGEAGLLDPAEGWRTWELVLLGEHPPRRSEPLPVVSRRGVQPAPRTGHTSLTATGCCRRCGSTAALQDARERGRGERGEGERDAGRKRERGLGREELGRKRDCGEGNFRSGRGCGSTPNSVGYWCKFSMLIPEIFKQLIFSALDTNFEFQASISLSKRYLSAKFQLSAPYESRRRWR
jgi:hypothetical protein